MLSTHMTLAAYSQPPVIFLAIPTLINSVHSSTNESNFQWYRAWKSCWIRWDGMLCRTRAWSSYISIRPTQYDFDSLSSICGAQKT